MAESPKARANRQAQEILNARRREQGLPPEKTGKPRYKKPKPGQHREPPHNRTEEQTNAKCEKVIKQFGTTKAPKRNPVRLTDGKTHPVTVSYAEPRAPKRDSAE